MVAYIADNLFFQIFDIEDNGLKGSDFIKRDSHIVGLVLVPMLESMEASIVLAARSFQPSQLTWKALPLTSSMFAVLAPREGMIQWEN